MKQLSTNGHSLALPRQRRSLFSGNPFLKNFSILLVLALTIGITSCGKKKHEPIPFKASYVTDSPKPNLITGTGEGTIVGKSTFSLIEDDSNFPLLVGTATITAANGDQIFSTHTGSAVGPDDKGVLLITNYNTITGGTGRFKGASGSFVAHAIANVNYTTGTVTFDGSIILR